MDEKKGMEFRVGFVERVIGMPERVVMEPPEPPIPGATYHNRKVTMEGVPGIGVLVISSDFTKKRAGILVSEKDVIIHLIKHAAGPKVYFKPQDAVDLGLLTVDEMKAIGYVVQGRAQSAVESEPEPEEAAAPRHQQHKKGR